MYRSYLKWQFLAQIAEDIFYTSFIKGPTRIMHMYHNNAKKNLSFLLFVDFINLTASSNDNLNRLLKGVDSQ